MSSIPFIARIASRHAKDILTRDRARAQKIIQNINPHGPAAFREALRRRHEHHHHHHHHHPHHGGGGVPSDPTPSDPTPSDPNTGNPSTPTPGGVDVTDAGVTYTASVGVGNPPTQYTLLIDTGSSNTWVGADQSYVKTGTSKSTGESIVSPHIGAVCITCLTALSTASQLRFWLLLRDRVYVFCFPVGRRCKLS